MTLVGRRSECGILDRLVDAVRAGQSRALVLSGDPGVGKTALLEHLVRRAAHCRVVQIAGVESEMGLAFAGLHQMCAPLLAGLASLPAPQADALRTVFGLGSGPTPDRFLVGLAMLGLLAHAADERPLLFVASHPSDLESAASCGLKTCHVSRPLEYGEGVVVEPEPTEGDFDVMVGDLVELATVLRCEAPQYH